MFSYVFMKILESRPASYDRWMHRSSGGRIRAIKEAVAAAIAPGSRVLDVGAGTGELALLLAERGCSVVAFDASEAMVRCARERVARAGLSDRVEMHAKGVDAMVDLPNASFDAVVSTLVLSELSDDERALALHHALRCLKPGGLALVAAEVRARGPLRHALQRIVRAPMVAGTYLLSGATTRPVDDLAAAMRAAGFIVEAEQRWQGGILALVRARRPEPGEASAPGAPVTPVQRPAPRGLGWALREVWSLFFRLFPCPVPTGLRRVGNPGRDSPVLVTCNFHLTVERVLRALRHTDAWLLVADSKGVNVWCAACGHEFDTRCVVAAVRASGIERCVDHRELILPPLGAAGIRAADVERQTGWHAVWGPVRAEDIPAFLVAGRERTAAMKRATYGWRERLDTALGSLFPFFALGALVFALVGRSLLADYLVIGSVTWLLFMLACPWLPGRHGLSKALAVAALLALVAGGAALAGYPLGPHPVADAVIAVVALLVWGAELGGLASTLPSDLDPFLARLGIGAIGNVALAGTKRVDLLLGRRNLVYRRRLCNGCGQCEAVCPQGVWSMDADGLAVMAHPERCTSCTACLNQCTTGAVAAKKVRPAGAHA